MKTWTCPGLGSASAELLLEDLIVSRFQKPGPHGIVVAKLLDEDTVRLTVSLLNLADDARYRVVGSARGCARPHVARATVFSWATFPSSFRAAIVHEFRLPVVATTRNRLSGSAAATRSDSRNNSRSRSSVQSVKASSN